MFLRTRSIAPVDDPTLTQPGKVVSVPLAMFAGVWQSGGMKKQLADQPFHDRRYQERKRAEAERKAPVKKKVAKVSGESRVANT